MRVLVSIVITGIAVWVAALIIPGVQLEQADTGGQIVTVLGVAVIFGLVNAVLGPVLRVLAMPFTVLTLGLFALVVNALLLWLTAAIAGGLDLPFEVTGFWAALGGAIVISLVRIGLARFAREV